MTKLDAVQIDAEGFYAEGALKLLLGLTSAALVSARRSGSLRFRRCGNRVLYKGRWVLDWLEASVPAPRQQSEDASDGLE